MAKDLPIILAFSRDYQAVLFPRLQQHMKDDFQFLHLVMNQRERELVEEGGGKVIGVLGGVLKPHLNKSTPLGLASVLPADFADLTGYHSDPVMADRYLRQIPMDQAVHLAGVIYEYLHSLFKAYRFTAVLNEAVSIFPAHVLYYLATKYHVQKCFWASSPIPGFFGMLESLNATSWTKPLAPQQNDERLIDELMEAVSKGGGRPLSVLPFLKRRTALKTGRVILISALRLIKKKVISRKKWRSGDYIEALGASEIIWLIQCELGLLRGHYDDFDSKSCRQDLFFPIHYEPENILYYWLPKHVDQPSLAGKIATAIGPHRTLWIKDHPAQKGAVNTQKWLEVRRRHPNIRVLRAEISSHAITKEVLAVVAVASSAGFEALILGKPVFVFGDVYYRQYPGAIACSDIESFKAALATLEEHTDAADKGELRLACVNDFHRMVRGHPYPGPRLYTPESLNEIASGIRAYLAPSLT